MVAGLAKRLFTVNEYHQILESGLLREGDPVELLRGEIVYRSEPVTTDLDAHTQALPRPGSSAAMIVGRRHAACVKRLNALLHRYFTDQVIVSVQDPVEVDVYSEPQPDVCLLSPREDFYISAHPQPTDVLLLIEVADTTLVTDRNVKVPLYAENQIVEAWLVDINGEQVEVFRQPSVDGYQSVQVFQRGESITPQRFPDIAIEVNEILG